MRNVGGKYGAGGHDSGLSFYSVRFVGLGMPKTLHDSNLHKTHYTKELEDHPLTKMFRKFLEVH